MTRFTVYLALVTMSLVLIPAALFADDNTSLVPAAEGMSDYEARVQLAKSLSYDESSRREGVRALEQLLVEYPEKTEVRTLFAQVLFWQKQFSKSALVLRPLYQQDTSNPLVSRDFGRALIYSGQHREGIAVLSKSIRQGSTPEQKFELLHIIGDSYWKLGDTSNLIEVLRKARTLRPRDVETRRKLANALTSRGAHLEALFQLEEVCSQSCREPRALADLARISARLGREQKSKSYYKRALQKEPKNSELIMSFAEAVNSWGDFYLAEELLAPLVDKTKKTKVASLLYAKFLETVERYFEAEEIYRALLRQEPESSQLLFRLSQVYYLASDHKKALSTVENTITQARPVSLHKKSEELKRKIQLELIEKKIELAKEEKDKVIRPTGSLCKNDICEMAEADRLFEEGRTDDALQAYRSVLEASPNNLLARIQEAFLLAVTKEYDASIERYQELVKDYPKNRKVMLGYARVLSWRERYRESLDVYEILAHLSSQDPAIQMERARVAFWAKEVDLGAAFLEELYRLPVDDLLRERFKDLHISAETGWSQEATTELEDSNQRQRVYQGYEHLQQVLEDPEIALDPQTRDSLTELLIEYYAEYKIQKTAYLEREAKLALLNKHFVRSIDCLDELIEEMPGHKEALFDRAQAACQLQLYDQAEQGYRQLLQVDPYHSRAGDALRNNLDLLHPHVQLGQSYWREEGRGELSGISRYRSELDFVIPIRRRLSFSFGLQSYNEKPKLVDESYRAHGGSLGASIVVNDYIRASLGWRHKDYEGSEFESTDTGHARLNARVDDLLELSLGFVRQNEIANVFALRNDIQSNRLELAANSSLSKEIELGGDLEYRRFDDGNNLRRGLLFGSYMLNDHPRELKLVLAGEYRDSSEGNRFVVNEGTLIDIVHPYWSPENYFYHAATLIWRHEISDELYCGNELRDYQLRLRLKNDSERNLGAQVEGAINYDLNPHWRLVAQGLIHRSEQWDAEQLWLSIRFRP